MKQTIIPEGAIWKAEKTKVVNLDRYNMIERKEANGTLKRHFIGNDMDRYGARVSSVIQEYDEETKTGVTASNTKYVLHGEPGLDVDAIYLLEQGTGKPYNSFIFKWN